MKPGLYANIHAKRKRIKAGSGEKMRQVGSQGAPTQQSFIDSAKTAKRAGGGMMDIYGMTAPLGYKEAGEVGIRERIYNWLGPKDKISDEQLRLKGINPESVLPEERPVDPDQPEGVLQGIFGQLFGGRGAEGSEISPAEELKFLELQLMLEKGMPGSTLMPPGNPDKIKRLEKRIIELYTQLGE